MTRKTANTRRMEFFPKFFTISFSSLFSFLLSCFVFLVLVVFCFAGFCYCFTCVFISMCCHLVGSFRESFTLAEVYTNGVGSREENFYVLCCEYEALTLGNSASIHKTVKYDIPKIWRLFSRFNLCSLVRIFSPFKFLDFCSAASEKCENLSVWIQRIQACEINSKCPPSRVASPSTNTVVLL